MQIKNINTRERFLLLFFIVLPFEATGVHFYAVIPLKLIFSYLFVLFSLSVIVKIKDRYDKIILIFLYVMLFSLLINFIIRPDSTEISNFADNPNLSWVRGPYHTFKFLLLFILYKGIKEICSSGKNFIKINRLMHVIASVSFIVVIYGFYQIIGEFLGFPFTNINNLHKVGASIIIGGTSSQYIRIFSVFGEPKGYGSYLIFIIPLLIPFLYCNDMKLFFIRITSKAKLILVLLFFLSLLLTFSRSAFYSTLLTLTIVLFSFRRIIIVLPKYKTIIIRSVLLFGFSIFLWVNIGFFYASQEDIMITRLIEPITVHLSQAMAGDEDDLVRNLQNVGHNFLTIKQATELLSESPLLGFGPGQFAIQAELRNWSSWKENRHGAVHGPTNFLAYMIGNCGLIGSFLLILFFYLHISKARKHIIQNLTIEGFTYENLLHIGILFSAIVSFIQFLMIGGLLFLYPFIALGLLACINRLRSDNKIINC